MILNKEEIIKRILEENLVENFSEDSIQPSGIDLRIDKLYKIKTPGKLLINRKENPEIEEIIKDIYEIEPEGYYLCSTFEKINMPRDLVGIIFPRSTLFRMGISLRTAIVDPGYKGRLILGIKNETNYTLFIERFSRICQIIFIKTKETEEYKGQYQGGKVI